MMPDSSNEISDPCQISQGDELGEYTTVRSLINALKDKLLAEQEKHLDWKSTTNLEKNLNTLEEEYKGITETVNKYQQSYENLSKKLRDYETFYEQLKSETNDSGDDPDNILYKIRAAIDKLKKCSLAKTKNPSNSKLDWKDMSYDDRESYLFTRYYLAKNNFLSIKSCIQRTEEQLSTQTEASAAGKKLSDPIESMIAEQRAKGAKEEFYYYKNFQDKIQIWFSDLDNLQKKINPLDQLENDRSNRRFRLKYAYRLEFEDVLKQARVLTCCSIREIGSVCEKEGAVKEGPITAEELKKKLTEKFRDWVLAVYKYFYWQRDYLLKQDELDKSWKKYEEFRKTYREQFISEAEEVPPEIPTNNGGCD